MNNKESKMKRKDKNKEKNPPLTRESFFKVLHKVTKPVSSEKEKSITSADRPSGDYSETHTH